MAAAKKPTTSSGDRSRKESPFEGMDKGGFHKWLGKKEGAPITEKDIAKGLACSDPRVRKMAQAAKNARQAKKDGKNKPAHEGLDTPIWMTW